MPEPAINRVRCLVRSHADACLNDLASSGCVPRPETHLLTSSGWSVLLIAMVALEEEPEDGRDGFITLEDEHGLSEARIPPAVEDAVIEAGPLVLVEGEVKERHGVPYVTAAHLGRALPADHRVPLVRPDEKSLAG